MLDDWISGSNAMIVETFDDNNHVFYVIEKRGKVFLRYEDTETLISELVIKPDLLAIFADGTHKYGVELLKPCDFSLKKVLAKDFYIDPEVFNKLINNGTISYSKAMADLYDLPIEYSCDIKHHTRDYKHHKTKELTLRKMRSGQFN